MNRRFNIGLVAGVVGVFAHGVVVAADPAPNTSGLLSLPNARVITKAPRVAAVSTNVGQSGVRAFVNPETGRIGGWEPSAEDVDALAPKVRNGNQDRAKSVSAAPEMRTSADGRITGVRLQNLLDDNDIMPYTIARRDEAGRIQQMCVQGEKAALKAMGKNAKEQQHAR